MLQVTAEADEREAVQSLKDAAQGVGTMRLTEADCCAVERPARLTPHSLVARSFVPYCDESDKAFTDRLPHCLLAPVSLTS